MTFDAILSAEERLSQPENASESPTLLSDDELRLVSGGHPAARAAFEVGKIIFAYETVEHYKDVKRWIGERIDNVDDYFTEHFEANTADERQRDLEETYDEMKHVLDEEEAEPEPRPNRNTPGYQNAHIGGGAQGGFSVSGGNAGNHQTAGERNSTTDVQIIDMGVAGGNGTASDYL